MRSPWSLKASPPQISARGATWLRCRSCRHACRAGQLRHAISESRARSTGFGRVLSTSRSQARGSSTHQRAEPTATGCERRVISQPPVGRRRWLLGCVCLWRDPRPTRRMAAQHLQPIVCRPHERGSADKPVLLRRWFHRVWGRRSRDRSVSRLLGRPNREGRGPYQEFRREGRSTLLRVGHLCSRGSPLFGRRRSRG